MKQESPWNAILKGRSAKLAWTQIEQIDREIDLLEQRFQTTPHFHLFTAGFGASLFSYYLFKVGGGIKHEKRARSFLNMTSLAIDKVEVGDQLYSGFTGTAWLMEHFRRIENLKWSKSEDPNQEIDQYLLAKSKKALRSKAPLGLYGLVDGWVGYGMYGLERSRAGKSLQLVDNVIKFLFQKAEITPQGMTWYTKKNALIKEDQKHYISGHYNLGLSHGTPGIIGFLSTVLTNDKNNKMAREMLMSSIQWIINQDRGEHFGFIVYPKRVKTDQKSIPRLAWCYGDLGIAVALLKASKVLKDQKIESRALEIAKRASQFVREDSRITDPFLCHGGSGAFHLFNRLYQYTGDGTFLKTALFWLEETFSILKTNKESLKEYNILTGRTGLALSLLAGVSNVHPTWDRYLLISQI